MAHDVDKLEGSFAAASKKLGSTAGAQPLAQRRGVEAKYRDAYQALVKAGRRPQIRAKYRSA